MQPTIYTIEPCVQQAACSMQPTMHNAQWTVAPTAPASRMLLAQKYNMPLAASVFKAPPTSVSERAMAHKHTRRQALPLHGSERIRPDRDCSTVMSVEPLRGLNNSTVAGAHRRQTQSVGNSCWAARHSTALTLID